ncbi:MAG: hypothetical protein ABDH61_03345 [Acidilobaceae archaeon]
MFHRHSPLVITTSRRSTRRTRSLVKELALLLGAVRVTRGKKSLPALYQEAAVMRARAVVIIANVKGNPGVLRIYHVKGGSLFATAAFRIEGVSLARESGKEIPRGAKRLSIESEKSPLAEEVAALLRSSLPPLERGRSLVLRVEEKEGRAEVSFHLGEVPVGPTLRLRPLKK